MYHRNGAVEKWNSLFWDFVFLGLCLKDVLHVEIHVQEEYEDVILVYTNTTLFNFSAGVHHSPMFGAFQAHWLIQMSSPVIHSVCLECWTVLPPRPAPPSYLPVLPPRPASVPLVIPLTPISIHIYLYPPRLPCFARLSCRQASGGVLVLFVLLIVCVCIWIWTLFCPSGWIWLLN